MSTINETTTITKNTTEVKDKKPTLSATYVKLQSFGLLISKNLLDSDVINQEQFMAILNEVKLFDEVESQILFFEESFNTDSWKTIIKDMKEFKKSRIAEAKADAKAEEKASKAEAKKAKADAKKAKKSSDQNEEDVSSDSTSSSDKEEEVEEETDTNVSSKDEHDTPSEEVEVEEEDIIVPSKEKSDLPPIPPPTPVPESKKTKKGKKGKKE